MSGPTTTGAISRCIFYTLSAYSFHSSGSPPPNVVQEQPGDKNVQEEWKLLFQRQGEIIDTFVILNSLLEVIITITATLNPIILEGFWFSGYTPQTTALEYLGFALLLSGAAIREHCYKQLGQHFMWKIAIRKNHKLIKTGLYKYIRNPAYLGALLTMSGVGLIHRYGVVRCYMPEFMFGTWGKMLWWGTFVLEPPLLLAFRIPKEEKALEEKFGEEYREYRRQTWRILPGLY